MMKTNWIIALFVLVAVSACKPKDFSLSDLTPNTDSTVVNKLNPRVVPSDTNPNMMIFTMDEVKNLVGVWLIGGKRFAQPVVSRYYDFAGQYTVQAFAYDHNGTYPPLSISFTVEENDPGVCSNPVYMALTGGCEMPEGKTWMLSEETGYYGLGDIKSFEPDWWAAERGSHNGVYDDRITFVLDANKTYRHVTNGTSGLDSQEIPYEDYTSSWNYYTDATGRGHIELIGTGFFPPQPSETQGVMDYTICELTESHLRLKVFAQGATQAWFYHFVPAED